MSKEQRKTILFLTFPIISLLLINDFVRLRGLHRQALGGDLLGGIENAIDFFLEVCQQNMGRGFHSFVRFAMKCDVSTTAQDAYFFPFSISQFSTR